MKKVKIKVETDGIKHGLYQYDFPEIKDLDYTTICFRIKKTVTCNNDILLEKNDLIPFYSQVTSWGKESPGVVLDFRKNDINLEITNVKKFNVDFEYNTLTKRRKLEIERNRKVLSQKSDEHIKSLVPKKRVQSNIINLINRADKKHNFSIENDNIDELLKQIDYSLIICSPEISEKYGITTVFDTFLPPEIILCIKKDMTSETIFITDYMAIF